MKKGNLSKQEQDAAARRRRQIALAAVACVLFYAFLSFFLGQMGFIRYIKLCRQRSGLQTEIAALKTSNQALKSQVTALRTDPLCIEKLAREQGLVKDGETVYQYEDE